MNLYFYLNIQKKLPLIGFKFIPILAYVNRCLKHCRDVPQALDNELFLIKLLTDTLNVFDVFGEKSSHRQL